MNQWNSKIYRVQQLSTNFIQKSQKLNTIQFFTCKISNCKHIFKMRKKMRSSASVGYGKSAELSVYKALAQKLAQNIQKMNQDPRFKTRWIWQLIQNAKDVPNQFNKVNMKVQIHDSELKFMHNGDPFLIGQLQSIINQYSSKVQKNQQQSETTGKYGTGFITTYILSKNISIQGIIKSTSEEDQQEDEQDQQQDDQDNSKGRKMRKPNQIKMMEQQAQEQQEYMICPLQQQSQEQSEIYQKFKVFLRRDYKNRDKDFPKTLMKNDEKIRNQLKTAKQLAPWKRSQKDLDTVFSYTNMDGSRQQIIQIGIQSLKSLFPYALLFNPKLNQIEVCDFRKPKRIQGFKIIRAFPPQKTTGLNVLTCKVISQKKIQQQVKLAFHQDKYSGSIIAVPIRIRGQQRHLCEIPQGTPKIFKQFPLIGTEEISYNYVFSSKKLYPNQQRSSLLLGMIGQKQQQQSQKVAQNWKVLKRVLQRARNLYQCLKVNINSSKQNFLHLQPQNEYLGRTQVALLNEYQKFKEQISEYQIFQCSDGKQASLKEITFICFNKHLSLKQQQQSWQMIDTFGFLFPNQHIPKEQTYRKLYRKLFQFSQTLWPVKYKSLLQCIKLIQNKEYDELCELTDNQQDLRQKFHNIYKYLLLYSPSLLKISSRKIFLTENRQIKTSRGLFLRGSLDEKHVKFLDELDLKTDLNSILIDNQMQKYFNDQKIKDNEQIKPIQLQYIRKEIIDETLLVSQIYTDVELFQKYLKYLQAIQVGQKIIETIKVHKKFKAINQLSTGKIKFPKIKIEQIEQYQQYLLQGFLRFLLRQITEQSNYTVGKLSNMLNLCQKSQTAKLYETIQWFDSVLVLQDKLSASKILDWSISRNLVFVKSQQLQVINIQLDDQDIKFYNLPKVDNTSNLAKYYYANKNSCLLFSKLVHQRIRCVNGIFQTTYGSEFSNAINSFDRLTPQSQKYYLNYIQHLMKSKAKSKNEKIECFTRFLTTRHVELLKLSNFCQQEIAIIYDLIKNKDQLQTIKKLKQKHDLKNVLTIMENIK